MTADPSLAADRVVLWTWRRMMEMTVEVWRAKAEPVTDVAIETVATDAKVRGRE